ncbi:hypothetical protein LCGC14_0581400 [marine sediment metagenome]|uniref:DUF6998 domain-containing protein n=1 Tax=marine sediment metagenome TaxID=412755 RepID=A0A0F9U2G1_9ZZZZ|nr:hypothetical protein [Methylophaga sp.]HEC60442.1 hypothetical protein [Methylophaga sp.]
MDREKFKKLISELYSVVAGLEEMFPNRHFTPDGHMVGSIGECLVANAYGLELQTASNKGYDATSRDGRKIEIKATQSKSVAFRSESQYVIVILIMGDGNFEEIYNGPGHLVWKQFCDKKLPSNGQHQISINKLKTLNNQVHSLSRIPKIS